MDFKQINKELSKFTESLGTFEDFKEVYPEAVEEDLTDKYIDLLIEKVSPAIGKEEQIEKYKNNVKITKRVSYPMETVGYVRYGIHGLYYNESVLRGEVSLQVRSDSPNVEKGNMEVFAGFLHNPIGQIRNKFTFNYQYILNDADGLIKDLINEMAIAMKQSRKADQAYVDYVARTGDLS